MSGTLVKLGDVVDYQTGHPFKSKEYVDEGVRLLRGDNIGQGCLRWDGAKFWPEETSDKIKAFYLNPGDVVLAMDRPWIEAGLKYSVVLPSDIPSLLVQRVSRLRGTQALDGGFLRYLIGSQEFTNYILDITTGTAVPHISGRDILAYEFELPTLERQREIASILSALDDKIELNRRMAATLEELARSLYRSWFVDFDPVRAKMEGRQPAFMDDTTAALFPDGFGENGLPEGWKSKGLSEVATFLNGAALQKYPARDGEESLPVIKIAELRNGVTPKSGRTTVELPPKYFVRNGDVLFSWSGSLLQKVWTEGDGALNQHLFKVSSDVVPKWYHYFAVDQHMEEFQAIAQSKATTMGHIQRHHLDEAIVILPDEEVLKQADEIVSPIFDKAVAVRLENQTLAALRDSLLPKLMSGELRVGEAQDQVTEVA